MSVLINDNAARTPVRRRRVAVRPVTISLATFRLVPEDLYQKRH